MKTLQYSFAQIEAFATIAETGSLSQAAIRLAKDRTTLRDLLDYLEDALGYRLFSREGRSLTLTAEGEQLFRQAHLLLRQAQAFESFAQTLPQTAWQALRLVYDPFVPREFLCLLADTLARRQIRLSCWSASRREARASRIWPFARLIIVRWAAKWSGGRWAPLIYVFTPRKDCLLTPHGR